MLKYLICKSLETVCFVFGELVYCFVFKLYFYGFSSWFLILHIHILWLKHVIKRMFYDLWWYILYFFYFKKMNLVNLLDSLKFNVKRLMKVHFMTIKVTFFNLNIHSICLRITAMVENKLQEYLHTY